MNKFIIGCAAVLCLFFIAGCQTTKNTVTGTAQTTYMVGKGLVEDAAGATGAVMAFDQWFKENYW
jgi:hypothetical protein